MNVSHVLLGHFWGDYLMSQGMHFKIQLPDTDYGGITLEDCNYRNGYNGYMVLERNELPPKWHLTVKRERHNEGVRCGGVFEGNSKWGNVPPLPLMLSFLGVPQRDCSGRIKPMPVPAAPQKCSLKVSQTSFFFDTPYLAGKIFAVVWFPVSVLRRSWFTSYIVKNDVTL